MSDLGLPAAGRTLRAAGRALWQRPDAAIFAVVLLGPALLIAALPLVADVVVGRSVYATFYDPSGADPIFAQHVIWFLGHPETIVGLQAVVWFLIWPWVLMRWLRRQGIGHCARGGWAVYWRLVLTIGIIGFVVDIPYRAVLTFGGMAKAQSENAAIIIGAILTPLLFYLLLFMSASRLLGWAYGQPIAARAPSLTECLWLALACLVILVGLQILLGLTVASMNPLWSPGGWTGSPAAMMFGYFLSTELPALLAEVAVWMVGVAVIGALAMPKPKP